MSQLVYLIVDLRIFFYICVRRRHIGFRLIIIIITDEILHRIFRKKLLKFSVELGSQSLIVTDDKSRFLYFLYNLRHGECLAGAGYTHESLAFFAVDYALRQRLYGFGLISCHFKRSVYFKSIHLFYLFS